MIISLPIYYVTGFTGVFLFLLAVLVVFAVIWIWKLFASLVVGG